MRAPVLALLMLAAPAWAQSRLDPEAAAALQAGLIRTADDFVLPAYEAQAEAAADLTEALGGYCAGDGALGPAWDAFAEIFLAWQRAAVIGTGPIKAAEGPMRVQLWPDPKDFAGRAVRAALAAGDPALLAPGGLEGRSIALTNLTALEGLLAGPPEPGTYACDLATAIAAFQRDLAADLAAGWTPGSAFRAEFDGAAVGAGRYPSVDALLREVMAGAVVEVDRLRKFKLLRGLGAAPGEARAERTEAVASSLGLASIETSLRALAELYDVPGGVFDAAPEVGGSMEYLTLAQSTATVADGLAFEEGTLAEIAAEDGEAAARLRGLADLALRHEAFLKTGFLDAVGLTAGFTAADGD